MPYYVLVQDAKILVTLFPDTKRIISLAPPHHIFGFIYTILIPRLLGVQCLDLRTKTPRQTFREIEQGDTIIAVPHFWQMIAEISNSFPQSVCGVTSAAVCPGTVYRGIYHMGIKSFYDVYGSTENSMIGFRSDPEEPIMLSPAWTRIGDDHIVRTQPDGKFSTPSVLQDLLDWQDERHFYICKRIDSAVQVVGANVFPSRVAEHLLSHEAVAECAVRLMRPDEGNRLKAFVVLRNDYQASPEIEEPLQGYLALSLSAPEQPRTITFGRALPRNNMGKLTDWTDKRLAQKQETN